MAKLKIGPGGLMLEAKLPENEVIQPTKEVEEQAPNYAQIAEEVAKIIPNMHYTPIDLNPLNGRLDTLESNLNGINESVYALLNLAKTQDEFNTDVEEKIAQMSEMEVDEKPATSIENIHNMEELQKSAIRDMELSERIDECQENIADIDRKLNSYKKHRNIIYATQVALILTSLIIHIF